MRVLALCSYPDKAAATRFRVGQFVGPLRERGIEVRVEPFLDDGQFHELYRSTGLARKAAGMLGPLARRVSGLVAAGRYDVLFVQREAMMFGPAVFEWLYSKIGRLPIVLDLDDATYVHYVSPTYGRLGSFFKFFGKTDSLIRRAATVTCGNRFIAEYVESKGTRAVIIPTVVDLNEFKPRELPNTGGPPILGWIGTHSTFPFLESIFPVLEKLAETHRFRLKIVGSGRNSIRLAGVDVELLDWELGREVADFRSLDVGLYPITVSDSANEEWIKGKSGFKAVQYMAVGVPFVMTPVGVGAEMGVPGGTHFNAETPEDWYNALNRLLTDAAARQEMGAAGRKFALEHYSVPAQADLLAETLRSVVTRR
jgi:glycosyltransferase involved in cell wall biosynthesis